MDQDNPFSPVLERIRATLPGITVTLDGPSTSGRFWIADVRLGDRLVFVEWDRDRGFAVALDRDDRAYGEGADEAFLDDAQAAAHTISLLQGGSGDE